MYKALVVNKNGDAVTAAVASVPEQELPSGGVSVEVECSCINYKDGLVLTGNGGLVKQYPHVPGIDFSGRVLESRDPAYNRGDLVILTGWRVGEIYPGGLAHKASAKGEWLVSLPAGWSSRQAMAVGTAGLTAMLAVIALEDHGVKPNSGEVLVTGAAGGVGSIAITILAALGYDVVASTGRPENHEYLKGLGARTILDRAPFSETAKRPLESERWAGCIDSVGGNTLARVLAQTRYGGAVAAIGLAGGSALHHTVIPFLLRGVNLLGIDSVMCPKSRRVAAWNRLRTDLPLKKLESMITMVSLADVPKYAHEILQGRVRGRLVVDMSL